MLGDEHLVRVKMVLAVAFFAMLAACQPQAGAMLATETTTTTLIPLVTKTPPPTATSLPTPSFTPLVFPTSLPPTGVMPFSGIYSPGTERSLLVRFNGPQGTIDEIVLPEGGRIDIVAEAISPDREWVVFTTGSIENRDIGINLLNLDDRSVTHIADLLSENFPDDLNEIADQVVYVDPEDTEAWDPTEAVLHSLELYLGDYAWSPDGRYLAFVGQIDGPSTDVYLYEPATGQIARLTENIQLVGDPRWSPDSDTILLSQIKPTRNYMELRSLQVVNVSKRDFSFEIKGYAWFGWLSDNEFLVAMSGDGLYDRVKVVDVENGQSRLLWNDPWPGYDFSYKDHSLLLHSSYEGIVEGGDQLYGVFLVNPDGSWEEVMQVDYLVGITAWSTNVSDYLIHHHGTTYLYSREKGLRELYSHEYVVFTMADISPDERWMLVWNAEYAWVYDSDAEVALEFTHRRTFNFIRWGPDSDGFFYWDDGWLFYMALPSGEVLKLERCERDGCWIYEGDLVWLVD